MSPFSRRLHQASSVSVSGVVPSGWPDATNTGYQNYPGQTGLTAGSGPIMTSNVVIENKDFNGGVRIGDNSTHPANVTFRGCRFYSNALDDANVSDYAASVTFEYCTFCPDPAKSAAPPTAYNQGYQYGIDQRWDGSLTVKNCDFWGWGNGIQWGYSSQANPVVIQDSWFHDARDDGGQDHTDAILENYGGTINDHAYAVFHHNTIASAGNTNGLALQGNGYYYITITNNYFSGFGYTLNPGGNCQGNQNVVVTDNVFSDEFQPVYGFLYDWLDGNGNLWRRNTIHLPNPPGWQNNSAWGPAITQADEGKYYYPDGTAHAADYTG